MADIQKNGNRKFWATAVDDYSEPARDQRFRKAVMYAFRQGRSFYLMQAVFHNIQDLECPQTYNVPFLQRAFESGFGLEISDCAQVVRGKAHG